MRPDTEERERSESEGIDSLPPGKLPGALPYHREQQLHAGVASSYAAALAASSLHRGRESEGKATGSRGKVQDPEKIPTA